MTIEQEGTNRYVWLTLEVKEAVVLQAILEACIDAGGNEELIMPIRVKLDNAKQRQELLDKYRELR